MIIIGLSGKAQSGKSTAASYIALHLHGKYDKQVQVIGFADHLKTMASTIFGWDGQKGETGRFLLQKIGETYRAKKPSYWIDNVEIWTELHPEMGALIIPDVRYLNEAEWLTTTMREKGHQTALWRVDMAGYEGLQGNRGKHASETDLDNWDFTGYISAPKGSLERLYTVTTLAVDSFLEQP